MSQPVAVAPQSLESLVAEVADEFAARQARGERPSVAEYAGRYPEHAAVLREVLTALELVGLSLPGGDAVAAPNEHDASGTLGDYRLLREVGRGGMGIVYEAEQISLSRRVALKVLPFAATMDPRQLQRFQNEARAAALLDHPNVVKVHAVGCKRGVYYFAMQFIDGQTLEALIRQRRDFQAAREGRVAPPRPRDENATVTADATPEPGERTGPSPTPAGATEPAAWASTLASLAPREFHRRVAEWGVQAAEALEHAHSLGVVHRDIKPGNLIRCYAVASRIQG